MGAAAYTAEDLLGTWRLVGASCRDVDSGTETQAFGGPHPVGFISYGSDQRVAAVVAYDNRIRPARVDQTTAAQRDELYRSMFAYAGTYAVCGDEVQHRLEVSWNETWTGTILTRHISLADGRLTLTARPQLDADGRTVVYTATWERVK